MELIQIDFFHTLHICTYIYIKISMLIFSIRFKEKIDK